MPEPISPARMIVLETSIRHIRIDTHPPNGLRIERSSLDCRINPAPHSIISHNVLTSSCQSHPLKRRRDPPMNNAAYMPWRQSVSAAE